MDTASIQETQKLEKAIIEILGSNASKTSVCKAHNVSEEEIDLLLKNNDPVVGKCLREIITQIEEQILISNLILLCRKGQPADSKKFEELIREVVYADKEDDPQTKTPSESLMKLLMKKHSHTLIWRRDKIVEVYENNTVNKSLNHSEIIKERKRHNVVRSLIKPKKQKTHYIKEKNEVCFKLDPLTTEEEEGIIRALISFSRDGNPVHVQQLKIVITNLLEDENKKISSFPSKKWIHDFITIRNSDVLEVKDDYIFCKEEPLIEKLALPKFESSKKDKVQVYRSSINLDPERFDTFGSDYPFIEGEEGGLLLGVIERSSEGCPVDRFELHEYAKRILCSRITSDEPPSLDSDKWIDHFMSKYIDFIEWRRNRVVKRTGIKSIHYAMAVGLKKYPSLFNAVRWMYQVPDRFLQSNKVLNIS